MSCSHKSSYLRRCPRCCWLPELRDCGLPGVPKAARFSAAVTAGTRLLLVHQSLTCQLQACASVGETEEAALLTDRTFLVKSIKMLKAKAVSSSLCPAGGMTLVLCKVLDGRSVCIPQDLEVRLPEGPN